jgi:prepilin signal peptidase PulO-like enzyme (type II secretory pathway)
MKKSHIKKSYRLRVMILLYFFIIVGLIVSYYDWKYQVIPDVIILPSIFFMVVLKFLDGSLKTTDFIAVGVILTIFLIPILLNLEFGGGDLRFGVFSALFVGLEDLGYFVVVSGLLHLILLGIKKKNSFGFAPAMSFAAIGVYVR